MDVITAIRERRSVRAFTQQAVPESLITTLLEAARWAPSGKNTQPWRVVVLRDQTIARLSAAIIADMEAGNPENPDYLYYPKEQFDPYTARGKACGLALYGALHIEKDDFKGRKEQWYNNFHFFGAPVGFIFLIDRRLGIGSWLDMGLFLENVMLAARGLGLETCPQASLAERPNIIRSICGINPNWHVVCGMAVGYADWSDPVNQYRTAREPLENFVEWKP